MRIVFGTHANLNIFQKLELWATNGKWTHCFLKTNTLLNGSAVTIEASPTGGVRLNLDGYENSIREEYECLFNFEDISCLYPYLDTTYGYLHAFGFFLTKIFKLKHNPIGGNLVCSGTVDTWLRNSPAYSVLFNLAVNDATPNNLYSIIVANPQLFKKVN